MALPTTNLIYHGDASVNTDLWQNASPYSTHPTDGGLVNYWDDVEHADIRATLGTAPVWRSGTPLMLNPCIDFNGSTMGYEFCNDAGTITKLGSDLFSDTAFTMLFAIYVEGVSSNAANVYDNEAVFTGSSRFIGLHLKNVSSVYSLQLYNWDGNADVVEKVISLNTSYVVMCRHESSNLYISLNGGSESSAASGTTTNLNWTPYIAQNLTASTYYNGRLGEVAIYNAALTGSNLTDAISYFTGKWLASGDTLFAQSAF